MAIGFDVRTVNMYTYVHIYLWTYHRVQFMYFDICCLNAKHQTIAIILVKLSYELMIIIFIEFHWDQYVINISGIDDYESMSHVTTWHHISSM